MIPLLKKYLENIPIDRVDIYSKTLDASFENLSFSLNDFVPDFVSVHWDNKFKLRMRDPVLQGVMRSRLRATIDNLRPVLHRIRFSYTRKSFPKISDHGVADFAVAGKGARIKLVWELLSNSNNNEPTTATLVKAKCNISKIHITFVGAETKHSILDRLFVSLAERRIRRKLERAVEEFLVSNIGQFNEQLNTYFRTNSTGFFSSKRLSGTTVAAVNY